MKRNKGTLIDLEKYRIKRDKKIRCHRIGDFYESFSSDAVKLNTIIGGTIMIKSGVQISGFPWHRKDAVIATVNHAGYSLIFEEHDPCYKAHIFTQVLTASQINPAAGKKHCHDKP